MAGAPKIAPAVAMAPVSVAEGPITEGRRCPQVALMKVKSPIITRHAEIIDAAWALEYPTAPATTSGRT